MSAESVNSRHMGTETSWMNPREPTKAARVSVDCSYGSCEHPYFSPFLTTAQLPSARKYPHQGGGRQGHTQVQLRTLSSSTGGLCALLDHTM